MLFIGTGTQHVFPIWFGVFLDASTAIAVHRRLRANTKATDEWLEMCLNGKLEVARISCTGDCAKCRRAKASIWIIKCWRVRNVKHFRSELHVEALCHSKSLAQH
jgi:hypothetical protein